MVTDYSLLSAKKFNKLQRADYTRLWTLILRAGFKKPYPAEISRTLSTWRQRRTRWRRNHPEESPQKILSYPVNITKDGAIRPVQTMNYRNFSTSQKVAWLETAITKLDSPRYSDKCKYGLTEWIVAEIIELIWASPDVVTPFLNSFYNSHRIRPAKF